MSGSKNTPPIAWAYNGVRHMESDQRHEDQYQS